MVDDQELNVLAGFLAAELIELTDQITPPRKPKKSRRKPKRWSRETGLECVFCPEPIKSNQRITKLGEKWWVHETCREARRRNNV